MSVCEISHLLTNKVAMVEFSLTNSAKQYIFVISMWPYGLTVWCVKDCGCWNDLSSILEQGHFLKYININIAVWETPGGLPVDSQWTPGGVVPPGL
jgi:hypothetical protein